jgi:hypothetical protein
VLASARVSLEPGTLFGPYRIVATLGRGGMASVYRAHDPSLDRDVALKVLPPEFLHDPSFAERFRQEARVAAKLEHAHVVPVHAFGIEGGRPWMAQRLMPGGSLADQLKTGPLAPARVAAILSEIGSALDYAHAHGIVHRDVKPANVLLDDAGRAYLADFGIARLLEGSSVATATGLVQGTPSYMAPEQAMGERPGPAADVYALAVMAFECLTGRVPFTGTTPMAILMKHVSDPVPEVSSAEVAPPLAAALRRGLAKAPGARWPSPGAFATALVAAAQTLPGADATPATLPTLGFEETLARPATPAGGRPSAGGATGAAGSGRRGWLWAAAGATGLLLVALVLVFVALRLMGRAAPPAAATVVARATPMPTLPPAPAATPTPPPSQPVALAPSTSPHATPRATPTPRPQAAAEPSREPVPDEDAERDAVPATNPRDLAARYRGEARSTARARVYCEPKLEPVLYRKTEAKDVNDSAKDLREAFAKHGVVEVVSSRTQADAVVQVLERGREPALVGMRKVRVRVVVGGESAELVGQDGLGGFNTWSGAAGGVARQVETWLASRSGRSGR